jgi:hypothetical protein
MSGANILKKKLAMEYLETYKIYSEYFFELDTRGVPPFIWRTESILAGFETNNKNLEMEKLLLKVRSRAIVTALLEHPAAKEFQKDMAWLAELAEIELPLSKMLFIDVL